MCSAILLITLYLHIPLYWSCLAFFLELWTVEDEGTQSFEMPGTDYPVTPCHIPEEQKPEPYCCENLRTWKP